MDKLTQLKEARVMAEDVIEKVDSAILSLETSTRWASADLLLGGALTSFVKRNKISQSNSNIEFVREAMRKLNEKLNDVEIDIQFNLISDNKGDMFLDVIFDNIFTDIRVANDVESRLAEMNKIKEHVSDLIIELDEKIKKSE